MALGKYKENIKIAFFDIDGTLVFGNSLVIPKSTEMALNALKKNGILCFICTGRHILDVNVLNLPVFDGYITTNGACCEVDSKIIYKKCIPIEDMERLILWQQGPDRFPCILENNEGAYLNFSNSWVEELQQELHIRQPIICDDFNEWSKIARTDIEQMLCFFGQESDEKILKEVLPGSAIKRWCSYFTDVIEKSCDKANGIDIILNHFKLTVDNAIAFGDGGNDISMLKHVGLGIAMGNANEQVKTTADYVTDSVQEDGIWNALKHFDLI